MRIDWGFPLTKDRAAAPQSFPGDIVTFGQAFGIPHPHGQLGPPRATET